MSDSFALTKSTSASTFDQIWVHSISGGQSDVYSNKANFTIRCAAPPPPPPAPPTNFKTTTDPGVCGDHVAPLFGALICGAALKDGDLVVVWDYPDPNSVDGFRIYQISGSTHTQIDKQSGMTGKGLTIKAADAKSMCFVVRAFKGSSESADSNSTCTGSTGVANMSHVDLPLTLFKTTYHWSHEENDTPYCGLRTNGLGGYNLELAGTQIIAGYDHSWDGGSGPLPCWEKIDHVYRGAVKFNTGSIGGKKIWKAVLSFTMQKTYANGGLLSTCASEIMYGVSDWTGANDLIPGDSYRDLPTGPNIVVNNGPLKIVNSTNFEVDVTDAVRAWLLGSRPNYGFVFRGQNEDYPRNNDQCASFYGNFDLGVDYFN